MTPKQIRKAAGWSQVRMAAGAQTTVANVRIFEATPDPAAVRGGMPDDAWQSLASTYEWLKGQLIKRLTKPAAHRLELVAGRG